MTERLWRSCAAFTRIAFLCVAACLMFCAGFAAPAQTTVTPLHLQPDDVIPSGNEWISLPDIRAVDGALTTFNAISMHYRGLLQVDGAHGSPVLQPYFTVDGKPIDFQNPSWQLEAYWIPTARLVSNGIEASLTYCAPPGSRAAFLRMTMINRRAQKVSVSFGVDASFGSLNRVTYVPVELHGERTVGAAPWVSSAEVFSYITDDTHFAWTLMHPGSEAQVMTPPISYAPEVRTSRSVTLEPGQKAEALFILSVGIEEFSAAHNARALRQMLDRDGADALIRKTADWCQARTKTTGNPQLDLLMNRNYLFTELYAWGRTIDTEQWVGVTSRSPRYYVSAAYWDRDAMLWSFPALLDIDPKMAARALNYAFTTQLRNTGTHSRFIDGVVLEDGFQLDEAVAPVIALAEYTQKTGDLAFLRAHGKALDLLRDRILKRHDPQTGLYSSLQDSQDEFQILPFLTYDNALTWRAFLDLGEMYDKLQRPGEAQSVRQRAAELREAILKHCVSSEAPGAGGSIFASATDGKHFIFTEIPPGSLMKLPLLGLIPESSPVFQRTYEWLHSPHYKYSYSSDAYGLPGSYRLPFTTVWSVADHLQLKEGRAQALKVLEASHWDGGIFTEGVNPTTARMDQAGRAFATAAGYMAHAICETKCVAKP